jgi:hypothetical protein
MHRLFWKTKIYNRFHKIRPLVPTLIQMIFFQFHIYF